MGIRNLIHRMTAPKVESRASDPALNDAYFTTWGGFGHSAAGVNIDDSTALGYIPLFAAVRNLSESIAYLPLKLYERIDDVPRVAADSPLYDILYLEPNPLQTSYEFRLFMMNNLLLRGNAYAQIVRDGNGDVAELWPLPASRVKLKQDNGKAAPVYEYRDTFTGTVFNIPAKDMLHIRGFHSQGLVGMALVSIGANALGLGIGMEDYSSGFFKNGSMPGGVLTHPEQLSADAMKQLRRSWEEVHGGPGNRHRVAILEEGMTWTTIGVTPEDSQLLDGRTFQVQEVARLFNIPLHRLQDLSHATFSNIEVQGQEYVTYTLGPWIANWEQRLAKDLLTREQRETLFWQFNTDAFLRGQSAARGEYLFKATGGPWQTPNETRRIENLPPLEGGDVLNVGWQEAPDTGDMAEDEPVADEEMVDETEG